MIDLIDELAVSTKLYAILWRSKTHKQFSGIIYHDKSGNLFTHGREALLYADQLKHSQETKIISWSLDQLKDL
jgi:hypothetical protein